MPLKIALVQVTDFDKYYDIVYEYSGFGTGEGAPVIEKKLFYEAIEKGEKPVSAAYPIGLLALAAYARERFGKEIEINIIDMLQQRLRLDALMERLEKYSPDIVGLSSFSSFSATLHRIAARIKAKDPRCKVIAGGPYCSASTNRVAKDANIDCVVYGEGEETFVELIKRALAGKDMKGIRGTARIEKGKALIEPPAPCIKDVDSLPFPAVDLIDVEGYWGNVSVLGYAVPWMLLFNSRGCPYRCIYCHNIFGKKTRFMSVERTFSEIMFYYKKYGIKEFHVWDDIFNLDAARGIELSKKLSDTGLGFRFIYKGGLRADIMKKGLLTEMIKAGACYICYAIETASPRLQKLIKKDLKLKAAADAINFTADAGVFVNTYNMLGFPTETREEMQRTIDYNLGLRHHSMKLFKAVPQEGTELYKMMEPQMKAKGGETDMYFQYDDVGDGVSKEEFKTLINEGRRNFYFDHGRVHRVFNIAPSVLSKNEFWRAYGMEFLQAFFLLGMKNISELPAGIRREVSDILMESGLVKG